MAFDSGAQLNADISFNGDGYQAMAAGSWTWRDPEAADSFSNYGLLLQGGYFVAEHVQTIGKQVGWIWRIGALCDRPIPRRLPASDQRSGFLRSRRVSPARR